MQGNNELSGLASAMHGLQVDPDRQGWIPASEHVGPSRQVADVDESLTREATERYWREQEQRENMLKAQADAKAEHSSWQTPPKGFTCKPPTSAPDESIGTAPNTYQPLADAPSDIDEA